jgi:hypothetical protein
LERQSGKGSLKLDGQNVVMGKKDSEPGDIHGPQGKYGAIFEYLNQHKGRDLAGG